MGEEGTPLAGCSILLVHHDPFVSRYVERALAQAGASVADASDPGGALALPSDWSGFGACVVSVRYRAPVEQGLARCGTAAPPLLLLGDGVLPMTDAAAAFTYPFAGYQIVEAIVSLRSAIVTVVGRSSRSELNVMNIPNIHT